VAETVEKVLSLNTITKNDKVINKTNEKLTDD